MLYCRTSSIRYRLDSCFSHLHLQSCATTLHVKDHATLDCQSVTTPQTRPALTLQPDRLVLDLPTQGDGRLIGLGSRIVQVVGYTYQVGLPVGRQSPIQVLTGLGVEQLHIIAKDCLKVNKGRV